MGLPLLAAPLLLGLLGLGTFTGVQLTRGGKSNEPYCDELNGNRFKRSVEEISNFDVGQLDLPTDLLPRLPASFSELSFNNSMPASSMVDSVLSVFLVLQLMKIRHIRSKPFFQDICSNFYPALPFDDCLTLVSQSLHKYDGNTDNQHDSSSDSKNFNPNDQTVTSSNFLPELLEIQAWEFKSLTSGNLLIHTIEPAFCEKFNENIDCLELLKSGFKQINDFVSHRSVKIREKRAIRCRFRPRTRPEIRVKKPKDLRKPVSNRLPTMPGEHVDHMVEMQILKKAVELSGIRRGSREWKLIRKVFNEKPNLQVLDGILNIKKGQNFKNWRATPAQVRNAMKGFNQVWKKNPEVRKMLQSSEKFGVFVLQLFSILQQQASVR